MKRLVLILALAATLNAQEKPAAPAAAPSPLAPLEFWIGGKWRGQLPPPPNGGTAPVLETTFAWMENHRAIRFDTVATAGERRRPYTSGIYAWHPGRKQPVFYYTDLAGALTEGAVTIEADGSLLHEFTSVDAAGKAATYRARITRDGNDAYWNEIFARDGEEWKTFVKVRYERAPAP